LVAVATFLEGSKTNFMSFIYTALYSSSSINPASVVRIGQADVEIVFVLLTCGIVFQLIVLTFLLLLRSNRQLNSLSLVSFYSAMTIELGLQSYYVVIVNVFSVILLYFMFLHFILYCGQL